MDLKSTNQRDNMQVISTLGESRRDLLSQAQRKTPKTGDGNVRSAYQTTLNQRTTKTRLTKPRSTQKPIRGTRGETSALIINKHIKQTKGKEGNHYNLRQNHTHQQRSNHQRNRTILERRSSTRRKNRLRVRDTCHSRWATQAYTLT